MKETTFNPELHREPISTPLQAQAYISSIIDAGFAWHWDDDPADIVWICGGIHPDDFDAVRQRIEECKRVSWAPFEDIFDYTLSRQGTGSWESSERGEVKVLMQWADGPLMDAKGEPLAPGWYHADDFSHGGEVGPFLTRAAALEDHGRRES